MTKVVLFFVLLLVMLLMILSVFYALIPVLLMRLFGAKAAAERWARTCGTALARVFLRIAHVRLHNRTDNGIDPDGYPRVCFIANHTSILDIPAIIAGIPAWTAFIVKSELKRVPVLHFWIESLNCVYMKRGVLRESARAIETGARNIRGGIHMTIFPEGTRSKTGKIARFKGGSFKLAQKSEAVIIPVVIKGIRPAFEAKRRPGRVDAQIKMLDPIPTEGMDRDELRLLPERVENLIREAYEAL